MSGELDALRRELLLASPSVCGTVFDDLAPRLLRTPAGVPVASSRTRFKDLNDPIWKTITLEGVELNLLDLPLMQRLRHVRQLGMAYLVFPSATHSRLEHSIGALHAAKLLYDRLTGTSSIGPDDSRELRDALSIAALVHDCGHTAFSHVGERVLQALFREEFPALLSVLNTHYPDDISKKNARAGSALTKKPAPAAELLSVLFVLSPAMEVCLGDWGQSSPADTVLMACGLIIGRPKELIREGKSGGKCYHNFVKAIVSGDLDADKLDYVARDAYFAGMPISADMTRLLSQMSVAELDQNTEFEQVLDFESPNPNRYELLGIKPAGCSALEMFVMTRSYLFERIYCHHKVRAAERTVERLLRQRLGLGISKQHWGAKEVLDFLFNPAGDDAVLWSLRTEELEEDTEHRVKAFADRVLLRELPQRALALSPRLLVDYDKNLSKMTSAAAVPWDSADTYLRENATKMEAWICKVIGLAHGDQVYVDLPVSNPIKENPDIWVLDKIERSRLVRVNHYFDAEQLANAYQNVKQVAWIFSGRADRAKVAAAAAVFLASRFDLLIGIEAFRQAKLTRKEFLEAVAALNSSFNSTEKEAANNLILFNASKQTIRSVPGQFETALIDWDAGERSLAAARLAEGFANVGVSRTFYSDFLAALLLLSFLARHAKLPAMSPEIDAMPHLTKEARFQAHLIKFLSSNGDFCQLFRAKEHTAAAGGFTDVIIESLNENARDIVIELKSEERPFLSIVEAHAGQPCRYAEDMSFGRVSFLYSQFADESFHSVADTLLVRKPKDCEKAPHAIICLGTKGFLKQPSASAVGKATVSAVDSGKS